MDYKKYVELIKKGESKRPEKYAAPLHLPVMNDEFKAYTEYLQNYNNKISAITGSDKEAVKGNLLIDQMRLNILAKHYEKTYKNKEQSWSEWIVNNAGFRKYCGAGTNILSNIEENADISHKYIIDDICRRHDIAYAKASKYEDQKQADKQMLKEIVDNYLVYNMFGTIEEQKYTLNYLYDRVIWNTGMNYIKGMAAYTGVTKTSISAAKPFIVLGRLYYYKKYATELPDYNSNLGSHAKKMILLHLDYLKEIAYKDMPFAVAKLGFAMATTSYFKDYLLTAITALIMSIKILGGIAQEEEGVAVGHTLVPLEKHDYNPMDIKEIIDEFFRLQQDRADKAGVDLPPYDIPTFEGMETIVSFMDNKYKELNGTKDFIDSIIDDGDDVIEEQKLVTDSVPALNQTTEQGQTTERKQIIDETILDDDIEDEKPVYRYKRRTDEEIEQDILDDFDAIEQDIINGYDN